MRHIPALTLVLAISCLGTIAHAQDGGGGSPDGAVTVISSEPVIPYLTPAARDVPVATFWQPGDPVKEVPRLRPHPVSGPTGFPGAYDTLLDLQLNAPDIGDPGFLIPLLNFGGQGYTGVNPPDTVGDVGPNHYIQAINGSSGSLIHILDKSGIQVLAPFALESLGSGACAGGAGDPIILYDELADRWVLTEFAGPAHLCIYVSQTADPTGTYFGYVFPTPNFPDYPKYSVWPDAYYLGTNESSPKVYALDRSAMLTGSAASIQSRTAASLAGFGFQMLTPADVDGPAPPAGAPGYFLRHRDDEAHNAGSNDPTQDFLEIFEFSVDWATPTNSTFALVHTVPVAEFDSDLCGYFTFSCIPQPGGGLPLDPLREVTMWRNQYRNFGTHETIVGNLATDVDGTDHAGVRWFELRRVSPGGWTLHQEGTYAPDADNRWMGAIAMDGDGNLAVGYNISSTSTFPGVRFAGRLASDPLGTLPQAEGVIVNGTGSNGSIRYGDYSAMSIDPADDCTFWFTGEWNASSQWSTQIATLKFDSCGVPPGDFTMDVVPTAGTMCSGGSVQASVDLVSIDGFSETVVLDAFGNPGGTTASFAPPSVIPTGSSTMTISGSAAAGVYPMDVLGFSTSVSHVVGYELTILGGPPAPPALTSPADGATDVSHLPTFSWAASPDATAYTIEIATDPNFTNLVEIAVVSGTSHTATNPLAPGAAHFWRVSSDNVCGSGPNSPGWSFVTAAPSLQCNAPAVDFESGLPTDWSVTDDSPGQDGIVWLTSDHPDCLIGNLTNGSGVAACADSDAPGQANSPAYDTSLVSHAFSTVSLATLMLDTKAYYRDVAPGIDWFHVDVHDGSSWTNELTWDESREPEDISLDLSAYLGLPSVMVRFRYVGDGWDWYAQVDDVELSCGFDGSLIFTDGFESGDTLQWDNTSP